MSLLAKRFLMAALVVALFGTMPVRASLKTKPRALNLDKCAWICSNDTPCDTACEGADGGESTCGDVKVCACEPIWRTRDPIGQHCHNIAGSWQVFEHNRVTVEYGGCRDPHYDCEADLVSDASYSSEDDCCGAEGCWGDWC